MSTPLQPGQTIIFLGDHTTPDDLGYVAIIRDVLARFFPKLGLRLISAGSRGQTATGLGSQAMMEIITSSKPDWLVVGIGLTDAMREPIVGKAIQDARDARTNREEDEAAATFGPELGLRRENLGPISDIGREPEPVTEQLGAFKSSMSLALKRLRSAGIGVVVMTTVLTDTDPKSVTNRVLRVYNQAIREVALESEALVVDVEKAYRDVLDRALNYKQKLALASPTGVLNAQGEALLARTVLSGLSLLPQPGWRPSG